MRRSSRENDTIALIKAEGYRATVEYLAKSLGVSLSTVRRDLQRLEKEGKVKRNYGGVEYVGADSDLTPFPLRTHKRVAEKMAICRLAASFIREGDTVFIDTSSTAYCLTGFLKEFQRIKIVTNSVEAISALSASSLEAYSTGGRLSEGNRVAFVGGRAIEFIDCVRADIAFVSAFGVSKEGGVYDVYDDEIAVRKAMMRNAAKKILMIDDEKCGKKAPFKLAEVGDFDRVLCNRAVENFFEEGVRVTITAAN